MLRRRLVPLLAAVALAGAATAWIAPAAAKDRPAATVEPRFDEKRAKAVDAAVEAARAKAGLIGLAVAVIENDELVHVGTYGLADREAERPVTTDTLFRWASISKSLTAVAALQLVEQKKLALDDPARKHWEALPENGLGAATIEQLLCHRGGVGHYRQMGNWKARLNAHYGDRATTSWSAKKSVAVMASPPLVAPPGTKYHYTTFGYNLLGALVETAGKQPFPEQVAERIAKPLGMTTLEPDYEFVKRPHRTAGYRRLKDGAVVPSEPGDVSWKLPGGGFHSTVGDLARFGVGLLKGKLLETKTRDDLWRSRDPKNARKGYALGFSVQRSDRGVLVASHSGAQARTRTLLVLEPLGGRGIAVMTNSEWGKCGGIRDAARKALGW